MPRVNLMGKKRGRLEETKYGTRVQHQTGAGCKKGGDETARAAAAAAAAAAARQHSSRFTLDYTSKYAHEVFSFSSLSTYTYGDENVLAMSKYLHL